MMVSIWCLSEAKVGQALEGTAFQEKADDTGGLFMQGEKGTTARKKRLERR